MLQNPQQTAIDICPEPCLQDEALFLPVVLLLGFLKFLALPLEALWRLVIWLTF